MALINPPKRPQHLADDKMSPCTTQSAFPKQMFLSLKIKPCVGLQLHAATMQSNYICWCQCLDNGMILLFLNFFFFSLVHQRLPRCLWRITTAARVFQASLYRTWWKRPLWVKLACMWQTPWSARRCHFHLIEQKLSLLEIRLNRCGCHKPPKTHHLQCEA